MKAIVHRNEERADAPSREDDLCAHELDTVIASTVAEAAAIRPHWSLLRKKHGSAPDADPDFFLSVHKLMYEGGCPHVVVFREQARPNALIVGRILRQPRRCRVGYISFCTPALQHCEIVYGGLVTDGTPTSRQAVTDYIETMLSSGKVDVLTIHHLANDHELASQLGGGLNLKVRVVCRPEVHWIVDLFDPATGQRTVRNSAKTRSTFRRKDTVLKRFFDGCLDLHRFTSPSGVETFVQTADSITRDTYQAALRTGVQDTPRWRVLVQALADTGHLRAYVLSGETQPLAYVFGSLFDDRFTLIATGFASEYRHLSPGAVLLTRVLDDLANDGVEAVDLGSLDADYKRLHATRVTRLMTLHLYARRYRPTLAWRMEKSTLATHDLAKRTAEMLGVFKTVRRKWRARLARKSD